MAKFKVGDRVKIVGPGSAGRRDRIGEMTKITSHWKGWDGWDWQVANTDGDSGDVYPEPSLEHAPRFAVGDEVRVKAGVNSKTHKDLGNGFVKQMDKLLGQKMLVSCVEDGAFDCGDWTYDDDWLEPWNPAEEWDGSKWVAKKIIGTANPSCTVGIDGHGWSWTGIMIPRDNPFIVINRHASGQLKPASNPHVHVNYDDAKIEAQRLADAHKGEEFCVFGLKDVVKVEKSPAELLYEQLQKERDDGELMDFSCGHGTLYAKAKIEFVARVADKVTVVYSEIKGA